MSRNILIALASIGLVQATAQTASTWKVTYQPTRLVNGAPVLLRVKLTGNISQLQGTLQGHSFAFRHGVDCACWYSFAGISFTAKPGQYPLQLEATTASGSKLTHEQQLTVMAAAYPFTTIKVAPEYVEPPKETLPRIEDEQKVKKQVFSSSAAQPLWNGAFKAPAAALTSGVFGSSRLYNGVKKNPHLGLDFRVTTGTPVHAANSGTVILARPLYFEGNCVVIDHGQGLMTLYFHLSEFKVKEGEKVERGQIVALSGGTGRSTAPHLHFAVRWQGEYLNPAILLKLTPP